jgi:hypothetical protein
VTVPGFANAGYRRNLERANSNQDVRNRFIANFVATGSDLSFGTL